MLESAENTVKKVATNRNEQSKKYKIRSKTRNLFTIRIKFRTKPQIKSLLHIIQYCMYIYYFRLQIPSLVIWGG